eukprot:scaffold55653_cov27-Prasinocladus_malaysianus.AAC.2
MTKDGRHTRYRQPRTSSDYEYGILESLSPAGVSDSPPDGIAIRGAASQYGTDDTLLRYVQSTDHGTDYGPASASLESGVWTEMKK